MHLKQRPQIVAVANNLYHHAIIKRRHLPTSNGGHLECSIEHNMH